MRKKKRLYAGKLLNVFRAEKKLPHGQVSKIEFIEHPGASLIVPYLSENEVVFVKQYRPVIDQYIYELPAGTLEKHERPDVCARREVIEETGYKAKRIKRIGHIVPVPGYSTERIYIYAAYDLEKKTRALDVDECMDTCILTRKQVAQYLAAGKIIDAKTICALTLAKFA